MAPSLTRQGVNSPTFKPASSNDDLSVPRLYEYHAKHSPKHPVFTYSDDKTSHDITYSAAWDSISAIASVISSYVAGSTGEPGHRPIVGVLAHTDTITYIYTLVAIMSLGYTAFPLAPRNRAAVIAHLLKTGGVTHIIASGDAAMQNLAEEARSILKKQAESAEIALFALVTHDAYSRLAGQVKQHKVVDIEHSDVTIILHSSGTTGLPKPIRVTRRGLIDLSNIPCFGEVDLAGKRIAAHTNPAFHAMGLGTLMWPLLTGATFALYKPSVPPVTPTPANFLSSWVTDRCDIVFCVPAFIEAWARDPTNLPRLQGLDCIIFSGASVSKVIGDMLAKSGVTMHPFWGSTEIGPATMFIPRDPPPVDEWDYFKMSKHIKFFMQPQEKMHNIFEPIMIPTEICFPHITNSEMNGKLVYAVGDLLERHPTDQTRWRVFGRKDDQIILSIGEHVNPVPIEGIFAQDPNIKCAIIFGRHHVDTGVLIEPAAGADLPEGDAQALEKFKDLIWQTIERANAHAPAYACIKRNMILIASPDKPLEYTPKGTPRRGVCLKLYEAEIDALYAAGEGESYAGNRQFPDRV